MVRSRGDIEGRAIGATPMLPIINQNLETSGDGRGKRGFSKRETDGEGRSQVTSNQPVSPGHLK